MPPSANTKAATVTVGCKLPHGLILRLFKMVPSVEPVMGGGTREVNKAQQVGEPVKLHGYLTMDGKKKRPAALVAGGYAMTSGVNKEFFDEWMKQNADSDLVKNNLIFSQTTTASAEDQGEEQEKLKCGLEALDPDNLPMKGVKTADEKEAA
jgi:hypothetical protein